MNTEFESLAERFQKFGQGQVFAFWNELSPSQREQLLSQAREVDLDEVAQLCKALLGDHKAASFEGLEPAHYQPLPQNGGDAQAWDEATRIGEEALRQGKVAAFTVAGGQGTRLGYDGPKGTFPVTPVRALSLFGVFAAKIEAVGILYEKPLHWFIMTSHQNHEATETFFTKHNFFGLSREHVHFFRQGRMPAVDFDGKILLESPDAIALSPDGHGGSLRALERSGSLELMKREGIEAISYFQVDNPLVRCVDAAFLGWHLKTNSEMSSKMIPKAYAGEKVGHFCTRNGHLEVVEYSDLPVELQSETDENGGLRFRAGSIAIHVLDRDFVARMAKESSLPFHRADKKIPTIDTGGQPVKPTQPNGVKFETFVFDALPLAQNPVVIETLREDDFSPVKNAEGLDSPQTCRDDQLRQWARWLSSVGVQVPLDERGVPTVNFEVSPRFGFDEATFAASWNALQTKPEIRDGLVLDTR